METNIGDESGVGEQRGLPLKLLRESGVLLALSTTLLYLISHEYGSEYLGVFGVKLGFEGFGLANLALLRILDVLSLLTFVWFVRGALDGERLLDFGIGALTLITAAIVSLKF